MENKTYTQIQTHSSNSDSTITTPSLQTVHSFTPNRSIESYSDTNNHNGSNIVITQPVFNKLLSESIKQERLEDHLLAPGYSNSKHKSKTNQTTTATTTDYTQQPRITLIHHNSRETINGVPTFPMSMTNAGGHLISSLNPPHLTDSTGTYFVPGLPADLTSSYKLPPSSNSDLPSPSTSSNSSNPPSSNHHHHQAKRHGEGGGDPTRKREVRLQKNREAARECRRKKKEYIKCLEERVTGLENQNKALIEELRQLKELYCQREETNNNTSNKTTTVTR